MNKRIFHVQALSALHVGTGQGVGIVDLPIMRAKATNLPLIAGSSLKGVLRDELTLSEEDKKTLFGALKDSDHAGAVAFGDAHLLILPLRSFAGTVAYATCAFILRQYKRDLALKLNINSTANNQAILTKDSVLPVGITNKIALEDLDLAIATQTADEWANDIANALYPEGTQDAQEWRTEFVKRFVILPDDTFSFLADTATEVRTRIRINRETRVVIDGALWTEENLPADSVLWGVLGVSKARDKSNLTADDLSALLPAGETHLQIGGKHTVGRGLCRFLLNIAK